MDIGDGMSGETFPATGQLHIIEMALAISPLTLSNITHTLPVPKSVNYLYGIIEKSNFGSLGVTFSWKLSWSLTFGKAINSSVTRLHQKKRPIF